MMNSYRDLVVWQKAMDLVVRVYAWTEDFPKQEQYGLTSQIRRAAVSIPSNIAEGRRRGSDAQFKQFLQIAYGSGAELETQLELSDRLKFGEKAKHRIVTGLLDEVMRMLNVLIRS